jgi:UbiD family decarboxylase
MVPLALLKIAAGRAGYKTHSCNLSGHRGAVHDRNTMGMNISPGKHGRMRRQKYFDQGKPCPVVCCFGVDPLLHMIATRPEPYGRSEFDAVGGIKKRTRGSDRR